MIFRARYPLIAVALLTACGSEDGIEDTSARTHWDVAWEVTEGTHPTGDSLGVISGVTVDSRGNVYASDRAETKVWVFDESGNSVGSFGRKGEGPGEFQSPTGIAIGPDGMLYVRDPNRTTKFSTDNSTQLLSRYDRSFVNPIYSDWMSTRRTRFDSESHLYFPAFNRMESGERTGWYRILGLDGTYLDSLEVPAFANTPPNAAFVRQGEGGGYLVRGVSHPPFAPVPAWDITPRGTLIMGDAITYTIRETDRNGELIREISRSYSPVRIPAEERRDSLAAVQARLDSISIPLNQVVGIHPDVESGRAPETYPAYMDIFAGDDGKIWVRRWVAGGHVRTVFDVLEEDGTFITSIELPREIMSFPTPWLTLDRIVAVATDPGTGGHAIISFTP